MASFQNGNRGFSLIEVLIAVGILSVGMIFIAGVFPAGIYFATIATERSIAAAAADEAFAKIRLYATGDSNNPIVLEELRVDELRPNEMADFNDIFPAAEEINPDEFAYPSTNTDITQKQYYWSALCRLIEEYHDVNNPNPPVQVTVFVSRKVSPNLEYHTPEGGDDGEWPMAVRVDVSGTAGDDELTITGEKTYINDGYRIVDNETGRIYRVLERYPDDDEKILLDRDWDDSPPGGDPDKVWVVPPPVGGGRGPCIAVYQRVISF